MNAKGRSVWQNKKTGKWIAEARVATLDGSYKKLQRTAESESEAIDGLLLSKREGMKQIVVAAAAPDFAKIITPRDANSIVNFEKLDAYFARAKEIFAVDAAIGRLTISQSPPPEINALILSRQLIAEG